MGMFLNSYCKRLALSITVAAGMVGFSASAMAANNSPSSVRSAQQQLQSAGYYHGPIDGVDGPMTHAAIRKYQQDNNLKVNGRLDNQTCNKLGVQTTGAANRSENSNLPNNTGAGMTNNGMNNAATVRAAQRSLEKKGFYKGNINGNMGSETQAAIREFQKSSNLNVTGQLDPATLSSLGVSK